jgi:hypothetical protein
METDPACAGIPKGEECKSRLRSDSLTRMLDVRIVSNLTKKIVLALSALALCLAFGLHAQDKGDAAKGKVDAATQDSRITIIVTGGDEKKPVDSASVYVKFVEERKLGNDKKIEMNLKTNQSGVCHVPVLPPGKFLIQVIAEGWKTYGEYYDVTQVEQTIHIELVRPPKWY